MCLGFHQNRQYVDVRWSIEEGTGENCIMRSFMIGTEKDMWT
jgi:hypothetical protein